MKQAAEEAAEAMAKEIIVEEQVELTAPAVDEAIRLADVKPAASTDELLFPRFADRASAIGGGIMLAGAAYPVLIVVVSGAFAALFEFSSTQSRVNAIGELFAYVAGGCLFGAVVGCIWTGVVSIVMLSCVYFFTRSLRLHGNLTRLGAFGGGLVGFTAVLLPYGFFLYEGNQHLSDILVMTLVGPALTTVLGQIGGAWGSTRPDSLLRSAARATVTDQPPDEPSEAELTNANPPKAGRVQFRIWHLLTVSVWISLLLTVIRLTGIDFGFAFGLLLGWAVYQVVTLRLGELLAAWLGPWWRRRKSRST